MRRILVLRGGALGDFIVLLPALAALRQRWPAARIELIGNARAAGLATSRGLLDAVHSQHEARWSALYGSAALPSPVANWFAEFDLILNYWPDPDGELRRRFPSRAGQIFLSAAAHPTRAPAAAHFAEPLRDLSLGPIETWTPLAAPSPTAATIAVHPGSGSPLKNWPAERWIELIAELPGPLLLIFGEAEAEKSSALAARASQLRPGGTDIDCAVNLPLDELVAKLTQCRLFLGHDSGISHLAAACGIPSILLFGPTDPAVWAPPAPHVRVIQRGVELGSIAISDVRSAVTAALARQAS
jgi:heptosyltransferase-3